jgi:DUF1680 family protein
MYNGALAGVSLNGDKFFYVNPLESMGNHHRQAWYGCACCPSQVSRFLPSIGNYIYGTSSEALFVNLFMGNKADVEVAGNKMHITQTTSYPWEGEVRISVESQKSLTVPLMLRIPGWCKDYTLRVDGKKVKPDMQKGYAVVPANGKKKQSVVLEMQMPVEVVSAHPLVKQNIGKRAIQRGPLVYCMEQVDNKETYDAVLFSPSTRYSAKYTPNLLGGIVQVTAKTGQDSWALIPYYAWDNREAGKMKVWIDYNE